MTSGSWRTYQNARGIRSACALHARAVMRAFFPFLVTAAIGCASGDDVAPPPVRVPSTNPDAEQCIAGPRDLCTAAASPLFDGPSRDDAVVWAKMLPEGALRSVKIAVRPEGVVERTPVLRNMFYSDTPPHALLRAKLTSKAAASIARDIAALDESAAHAFFYASRRDDLATRAMEVMLLPGTATAATCFESIDFRAEACAPLTVVQLHADIGMLASRMEEAWREAKSGTVSLGEELTLAGPWPLDADVHDGSINVPTETAAKIQSNAIYSLPGGDFIEVDAMIGDDRVTSAYVSRTGSTRIDDAYADLRDELLANVDRYVTSRGLWLGVPVGPDRFGAFKNREMAIVVGKDGAADRVFRQRPIETFDLTEDEPPIDL